MKSGKIHILKFTVKDSIKANKKASRDIALENSTGWISTHRVHKSSKAYKRNSKHKKNYSTE